MMSRMAVNDTSPRLRGNYGKKSRPAEGTSEDDDAPPRLQLWDKCEHIRSLIKDLYQELETADDKEVKDLATELRIDMPTNDRHLLVEKVREELCTYLSEPIAPTPVSTRSGSIASDFTLDTKKTEPLINFKTDDILVAKEQFIRFVTKAGCEKYPKKGYPGPSKEILKQIHQLFNEDYYRREDEYIISNPLKLEWHFSEEFIILAAVKYQYYIIWDTKDGMTDTMLHWQMPITVTPELRKESVQVVLYRHLKRLKDDVTPNDFCPPIYARLRREGTSAVAWQKTVYDAEKKDFFTHPTTFPEWITDDDLEVKLVKSKIKTKKLGLQTFFFKAQLDSFDLGDHLHTENVIYYFVIQDKEIADFQENVRPIEELHPTQAYVGKCTGTILDHWLKKTSSHCQIASRLCHHIQGERQSEDHFVPGTHNYSASLLECYLALAKTLKYKCAIFVLYKVNSESDLNMMEKNVISLHNTTNMHRGLNEVE